MKIILFPLTCACVLTSSAAHAQSADIFARDNLVAWCIVPFDAKKRGAEDRAGMLQNLGFKHFAYDWRAEHVPSFDAEAEALARHGVALTAWWFPTSLNADAQRILDVLRRHKLKTELWVTGGGDFPKTPDNQRQRVVAEANRIRPIAEEAAKLGCKVGLYNHGGWFGEPENQLAIIDKLKLPNVGIVYNLHHGHDHLDRFAELLAKMKPHLLALNLNGMVKDGDKAGKKILPLGQGNLDLELLRIIRDSGYRGRIGILGHTQDDAEARLRDNLEGLDWLRRQLDGKAAGPRPKYRTVPPEKTSAPKDHWGVDAVGFSWTEGDSRDDRWKDTDVGRFLASSLPLPANHGTVAKALSIRVGARREASICFDTEHLKLRAAWAGGFLRFTPARYGLIASPQIEGKLHFATGPGAGWSGATARYTGMHRHGDRVTLSYALSLPDGGTVRVLESPWLERRDGQVIFTRTLEVDASSVALTMNLAHGPGAELRTLDGVELALLGAVDKVAFAITPAAGALSAETDAVRLRLPPSDQPRRFVLSLWSGAAAELPQFAAAVRAAPPPDEPRRFTQPGPARWTEPIVTRGERAADDAPYVVDTLTVPFDNPYRALFFCAGHDFFKNGDAALCTVHGDVWRISGVDADLTCLVWKRYATGLYQPLGLRIVDDKVYVLGRDQITRLHDANGDGEADYYENFCNHGRTSPGGHDYSTCLETDAAGNFYFLTALEGLVRVSRDGKQRTVVASGFRNPNGLGIGPGDVITVAPQEGEWTPASHIAEARPGSYHGFGGPRAAAGRPLGYNAPLCWIPRRHDNSSGGQVWTPPAWGPLGGQMLHFSYGQCRALLVLRELLSSGTVQGGSVDLPLTFASGAMRGRFSPHDGQLYVSGLKGWVSSAAQDGCLQRVRYTGRPADLPVRVETLANGLAVTFSRPLDRSAAEDPGSYHLEQWNYKYSASYGSADYKVSDPRQEGHDEVKLASATLLADGRTVFLEVPSVQPVMQLAVRYSLHSSDGRPLRHTIHYTINEVGRRRMEPSPGSRPPAPLVDESKLNPGLIARFEQAGRRDARTSRLAALFVAAQDAPTPFLDPGPFAVRFEGFVRASLRGDVELTLRGRGDAVLHVHGKEVLRASGDLSAAAPARVTLFRGVNPISLEYRAPDTGAANVRLFWQGDDFHAEPVPPTALVHGAHDAPLQAALDLRRGRDLFAERHCGQCHREPEAPARDAVIPRLRFGLPPDLASVGARLTANWLAHCLLDPTAVDPDATMPRLLVKAQVQQAADLAAHLSSRSSTIAPPATEAGDVALGARLYEELNCLSCHRFTRPTTTDTYQRRSLYHVDAKYRPGMLAAYLRQPYAHHPAGRMPDFHLNEPEAAALATYLRREARGKLPELDAGDARRGAQLYRELRCANCHPAGTEQGDSVARLRFGSDEPRGGCVGAQPAAPVPDLHLEEVDRRALQTFLRSDGRSLTRRVPAEEAAHLVRMLNCTACHARDSTVSPRAELVAEEGSGLVPEPLPALTWTGDKLRASWLEAYLAGKHPQRLRPMLSTRMPAFPAYAAALAAGIAAEHGVDAREPAPAGFDAAQAETGAELVRPAALDCRQCHAIANEPLAGDAKTQLAVGIPFIHVRQRLRHEFYQRFVVDPPRYDLASKMPKLLADGRRTKVTSIHNGDARRQLDAIWHFILSAELVAAPDDKKPSGGR